MVLDSSAMVAIHLREPGHERLIDRIDAAEVVVVGVPTLLETVMVLTARLGQDARPMVFAFLRRLEAEVIPFNEEHLDAAESDQDKLGVILDYDAGGNMVSFEILDASKRMANPMSVEYAVTTPLRRPA